MGNELADRDKLELDRRRLAEDVAKSVEETLKKRYTWLAIVVSFLLGGGVVVATNQLTKPAERTLMRHTILLEEAEESLSEVNRITETARTRLDKFQEDVRTSIEKLNSDISGVSEGKQSLNDRLIETLEEVKEITRRIEELGQAVDSLSKGMNVTIQPSGDIARNISRTLDKTKLSQYTIYVHYHDERDRPLVSRIAGELRDLGYSVPDLRRVDYKVNDIRYYHMRDKEAAFQLEDAVFGFLKAENQMEVDLSPAYFGDRYQDVRQGVIELWMNFS